MTDTPDRDAPKEDELLADDELALAEALAAAVRAEPLSDARHAAILARVGLAGASRAGVDELEQPDAEEAAAARALAEALDAGASHHPDAELARALALASSPRTPAPRLEEEAIAASERALARALPKRQPRNTVLFVAFGAAGAALALAASVILAIGAPVEHPAARPELLLSRSLAPLLGAEASELSASSRLDRVATARSRDFRSNRYAAWGVR